MKLSHLCSWFHCYQLWWLILWLISPIFAALQKPSCTVSHQQGIAVSWNSLQESVFLGAMAVPNFIQIGSAAVELQKTGKTFCGTCTYTYTMQERQFLGASIRVNMVEIEELWGQSSFISILGISRNFAIWTPSLDSSSSLTYKLSQKWGQFAHLANSWNFEADIHSPG